MRPNPLNQMGWFLQFARMDIAQICKFTAIAWVCSMGIFIFERRFAIPEGFALTAVGTLLLFLIGVLLARTLFFWLRYMLNGRDFSIAYAKFRNNQAS